MNVEWLASDSGQQVISRAAEFSDLLNASTTLRKEFKQIDKDLITQAITQASLQQTLSRRWNIDTKKFLLTQDGISQATRPRVAQFRAQWIKCHLGEHARILDMTCGLGFDALEMARSGLRVTAIERDAITAECAQHNLRSVGVTVTTADATTWDITGFDAIFVDPARRNPKAPRHIDGSTPRIFNPKDWSPPWDFIESIAQQHPVIVKVAPGIDDAVLDCWDAQWISDGGDVVEAMLTRSPDDRQPTRTAVLLDRHSIEVAEFSSTRPVPVAPRGRFLISPNGAITRAGALDVIADLVDGGLVNEHIGWLTTSNESAVLNLLASKPQPADCFEIIAECKCDARTIAHTIRDIPASGITIMTRGVNIDVDALRKKVAPTLVRSAPELVIALYREDSGNQALIARRLTRVPQAE